MKLLVISSWFPFPPSNGSKLRAYHLLARLADRHTITLLAFAEAGEERGARSLAGLCDKVVTVPGNPFKAGPSLGSRRLFGAIPRSLAQTYSPRMQELVDAEIGSCDAAVAFTVGAALYLRPHGSVPRIIDEIEVGVLRDRYRSQSWGVQRMRRGLTWWKYARFAGSLAREFDRVTVVSDLERAHLAEAGHDVSRVEVVPNGVDPADLTRQGHPEAERLVYSGAVTYFANLDAVQYCVSEILPKIRLARPGASLQITGSTGDVDVQPLTAGGGVTFTGHVDDVKAVVANSSVCIVPLRIGGGTRLKILEAMALGTPVVATSKGAEGLTLAPETDILIADTPEDFARQTLRLMDNPELRARLTANARRVVERHYTWDRIGVQMNEIVESVAAPRRSARRHATSIPEGVAPRARA